MIGHRRPSSLIVALARIALVLCAMIPRYASAQEAEAPNEPIRLCITWGGGEANPWVGTIRLDQGTLSKLKLLGLDADAAGSMWIDQDQVRIGSLSPHRTDSLEVIASAPPNAKLTVELATGPKAIPAQAQVLLADLSRRPYQLRLDERGNTLEVRIIPAPTLDISIKNGGSDSDALIFAPGSQLLCELTPVLAAALHGTTLDVQSTLTPARGRDAVWKDTQRLAVPVVGQPKVNLAVPLQVPEGVYTVHIAVARSSGYLRDKFFPGAAPALAEQSFQIVVLDSHPVTNEAGHWEPVLEIDPTNPRWVERLPAWTQLRRIPGFNHGPLGNIRANSVDLPLGRFIELPPTAPAADPPWQAYSLPLESVGVPHLLEIDYPADEEQHFGLSVVEPNASGIVEGIQRDVGVYVEGLGRSEKKQKQTQRLIFWPRTQAPLLIVTNQHPTAAAHFGQIRVLKRDGSLAAAPASASSRDRLIAAYLSKPSIGRSFGATETLDATEVAGVPKSVDDYHTFYEGATRLSDYLHHAGYNSAVLSVLADGSSIYPTTRLLSTPRYETGRFTNRLRDVDGLELTLRVFDRERLTLIPAIEFTTPIPELELLRRTTDPQTSGLELVGSDGHTWLETNATHAGLAPFYNVLDPRVQQAMLAVVGEIIHRYGKHPAFGGL
ncbi:MAG TPA: hypothetical protein VHU84_03970, partial [Lacipirellulaceae bacterium]|nr:hypothetical protein [Lacipirellulaceae bacterium]